MIDMQLPLDILTLRKKNTEVVVQFAEPALGRWRVYQWTDGQCVNWSVTAGRWFPSRSAALEFLREKGYVISEQAEGFDRAIAVPQSAIEEFRKRSAQITDEAKRLGTTNPASIAELGTKTRRPKRSRPAREAERQSQLAARHVSETDALAFIEDAADTGEPR